MSLNADITKAGVKVCSRCIYDERVSSIYFDDEGICNYCKQIENLKVEYGTGKKEGEMLLSKIINAIKQAGKGKKYDCIIGVSGGVDSSYLVYLTKVKWGLRPLAVHYDNTWNSAIATMNIHKVLNRLNIDLYTHVVDNKEADDIIRSFFFSDVSEIDAATDLGFAQVLREVASKYSISAIFEGHSFNEEGITALGGNYFDGRYIQSIHRQYGRLPLRTYPLMTLMRFLKSAVLKRIKFIRPLWYLDYSKEHAKELLKKEFAWLDYGGHHLENRISAFCTRVYQPRKFGIDNRNLVLGALARNGRISRSKAWAEYNKPPWVEDELVSYFKKRLELTDEKYEEVMRATPKNWKDYPTYKKHFEFLRPLFFILAKANMVPMSFYLKYCFPIRD